MHPSDSVLNLVSKLSFLAEQDLEPERPTRLQLRPSPLVTQLHVTKVMAHQCLGMGDFEFPKDLADDNRYLL